MAGPTPENPAPRKRSIPEPAATRPINTSTSFVGFAPVSDPVVTILVVLDSPVGAHHGGDVGGPVFRRVAEQVLQYLDTPHDIPVVPAVEMAARRREVAKLDAREDAEDLQLAKDRDEAAAPAAPQQAAEAAPVIAGNTAAPTVEFGGEPGITVPSLSGQSVRGVTEACSKLGLTPVLVGTGFALDQSPQAGARVNRGTRIVVRFGRAGKVVPTDLHGGGD